MSSQEGFVDVSATMNFTSKPSIAFNFMPNSILVINESPGATNRQVVVSFDGTTVAGTISSLILRSITWGYQRPRGIWLKNGAGAPDPPGTVLARVIIE